MAKRFTDNEKWKKQFFKELSTVNKLFFIYVLDDCDHAGIWHVEPEIAQIRIGEKIDLESVKKELGKHVVVFDNGEKWFLPTFIDFQYGILNPNVQVHKSVIKRLKKYNLLEQFINCSQGVMDKDMDKDMNKDTVQNIWIRTFGRNPNIPEQEVTQELIDRFGGEKTCQIMKEATLAGFKKITTLCKALDSDGNIMPKDSKDKVTLRFEKCENN